MHAKTRVVQVIPLSFHFSGSTSAQLVQNWVAWVTHILWMLSYLTLGDFQLIKLVALIRTYGVVLLNGYSTLAGRNSRQ